MNFDRIVNPSDLTDSNLPVYINEQYVRFVRFMTRAFESEERLGFSTDLLQRLEIYRDFETYKKPVVEYNFLKLNNGILVLPEDEVDQLTLESGDGYPDENGILYIDEEVILYRYREGNVFYNLQRGASATTVIGDFIKKSEYVYSEPAEHKVGAKVYNISSLYLAAILEVIHKTFCSPIDASRVAKPIDRASILKYVKDFFRAKGTKLGIKALFKILFAENDVEVHYPGDRMIIPSKSTWYEGKLLRVVPLSWELSNPDYPFILPDRLISQELKLKSYNDDLIHGTIVVDYASSYVFEDEVQYEIFVQKHNIDGKTLANPRTTLTRDLKMFRTTDAGFDVFTITVMSTVGFPDRGVLIIDKEAIFYESKSLNQFFNCKRGYIGVDKEHFRGTDVHGPYYYEGTTTIDGVEYMSRSMPLGLVEDLEIRDPGVLHELTDDVTAGIAGRIEPREQILGSYIENLTDELVITNDRLSLIEYFGDVTAGVNSVYFDKDYTYVGSSNLPYYMVGPFSEGELFTAGNEDDVAIVSEQSGELLVLDNNGFANQVTSEIIGPELTAYHGYHIIPRRNTIKDNIKPNQNVKEKGTGAIGLFADGVPSFSNVAPYSVKQGSIARFNIINGGAEYEKPTLLINDVENDEIIRLDKSGTILGISTNVTKNHGSNPDVRITSGEGAEVSLKFDRFGRVIAVNIDNPGKYYKSVPSMQAVDSSGRGKGAVFAISVEDGNITNIEIVHAGIDYNPETTTVFVNPVGFGAVVEGIPEYYQFDRYYEIDNSDIWHFDQGGGFAYEDEDGARKNYGYIYRPEWLTEFLGDEFDFQKQAVHSPILGWAYDGNPIYGPIGYSNKKDDTDGFCQYRSTYVLRKDRSEIIPAGQDIPKIGSHPPLETTYPMGTFIEDYEYNPEGAIEKLRQKIILSTETPEHLTTHSPYKWILHTKLPDQIDGEYPGLLDEYNSVICNTPDFPKELYPGGVRCYFVTVDEDQKPEFPYIIGYTFANRPLPQDTDVNLNGVDRHRNILFEPGKQVDVEISDTLDGGVSEILVENGMPKTTKVGDIVLYNNDDTGGAGAEGRISFIKGIRVQDAFGSDITTVLLSHIQIINVDACHHLTPQGDMAILNRSHVFEKGSMIQTTGGAQAIVFSYNTETTDLVVKVITKNLIVFGEMFRDNRDQLIRIPAMTEISVNTAEELVALNETVSYLQAQQDETIIEQLHRDALKDIPPPNTFTGSANKTFFQVVPPDAEIEELTAGDLWWSQRSGRLYIWYVDEDNTEQWVVTQPTGTIPMEGALDMAIGYDNADAERSVPLGRENHLVTVSTYAPDERLDGSPHIHGDLWFSPYTNILYIWYDKEWVCTDPNGMTPIQGTLDIPNWPTPERIHPWKHRYETKQYVIVSLEVPWRLPEGGYLQDGVLWFSPVTGKLYIRCSGSYGPTWVQTNPLGMMPNEYALDDTGGDGGTINPPPLRPGPELPPGGWGESDLAGALGINYLWFEQLKYFRPEDFIKFYLGAPGTSANELARIVSIAEGGAPAAAVVRRGDPMAPELYHRTPTYNKTRYLFTVRTEKPHQMRVGDQVFFEGSEEEMLNGLHTVIDAGFVIPAQAHTVVSGGEIVEVVVDFPGRYYRSDFYISFYSGGGVGGYARCNVTPLSQGGEITNIEVIYGGIHYIEEAKIIWPEVLDAHEFCIFLPEKLGTHTDFAYSTNSKYPQNEATYVEVTSKGYGYERMPPIVGVYKKQVDRAEFSIEMAGTKIKSVEVLTGGSRYTQPIAVVSDRTNMGRGAVIEVTQKNGTITEAVVMDGGELYIEPYIVIVEEQGKYISLTEDIGRIAAFDVINPGRNISPDLSMKPEIQITTRCVVRDLDISGISPFIAGDRVYQGTTDLKFVEATVVEYIDETQILVLENVDGTLMNNERLYDEFGNSALVVTEGQADTPIIVNGISSPKGTFLDDTSKVSETYPRIQDSYYYQWFSYVISSPLEQSKYDHMVKNVVHPAGFIMFSDLTIHESVSHQLKALEPDFTPINN